MTVLNPASLGCDFDWASAGEIKNILGLDVAPERKIPET